MSRVLMVNDIAEIGGGKTSMLDVAGALTTAGFELHLACPPGPLATEGTAMGMTWHEFVFDERRMLTPRSRLPRRAALDARRDEGRRLDDLALDIGADIVHTGALVPHLDAMSVRKRSTARFLWHVNQVHPAYLFAGPLPDRIVSVSAAALRPGRWRRRARRRSVVVPNGVDLERFRAPTPTERQQARDLLGLDGDGLVLVTVARLEPSKGVDDLIEAVGRARSHPTLVVVGDSTGYSGGDAHERSLRARAAELGTDVRFLGARSDVDVILRSADAFVFASRWEAFGLVLAEASATGLPVITSDAGGCTEVVDDGETGIVVAAGDVAAFAAAIDALASDDERRSRLGTAGRAKMSREYDSNLLGARIVPVYRALAEPA